MNRRVERQKVDEPLKVRRQWAFGVRHPCLPFPIVGAGRLPETAKPNKAKDARSGARLPTKTATKNHKKTAGFTLRRRQKVSLPV
jgi:hypothetical protein